jgi:WD40 repeat protein
MPSQSRVAVHSYLVIVALFIFANAPFGRGQENSRQDSAPFLFGGVSSMNQLSKNFEKLTKVLGSNYPVQQALAAVPESIDRTRPIGIFGFWGLGENPIGAKSFEPILLVPTMDPQSLLTQLHNMQLIGRPEFMDGVWQFQASIFSCSAIERNGWLVVVGSQAVDFTKIPQNLNRFLLPVQDQYDLFGSFQPKQVPPSLRAQMLDEVKRPLNSTSPFSEEPLDKTESEAMFEKELLERLEYWGNGTNQCALGLKLPDAKGKLMLEFNALFEPDSNVSREFSQMTEVPSLFSKFGIEEESGRSSWKIRLPKFIIDFAMARFKEEERQWKEGFVNSGRDLGFSSESKQIIFDEASAMLLSTLQSGNLDALLLVGRKQLETISMIRAVETNRIETILMEMKKTFQKRPDSGQVEMNVEKHMGVTMHLLVLKMGGIAKNSDTNIGPLPEEIRIAIGISKEVLMFATGESPVGELKKSLDNTRNATFGKKNNDAIFSTEFSVSQLLSGFSSPFATSDEKSKPKTGDMLNSDLRTVSNGLAGQIAIEIEAIDWLVNTMPKIAENKVASTAVKPAPRDLKPNSLKASSPRSAREPSSTSSKNKLDRNAEIQEAMEKNKFPEIAKFTELAWGVKGIDFSPDGQLLAGVKIDESVVILSLRNKSKASSKEKLNKVGPLQVCVFSPDGKTLVVGGFRGVIQVFSVGINGTLKETTTFSGHSTEIKCLSISDDGKHVLSGDQAKKVFCWNITSGDVVAIISGFDGPIKAVHLQPKSRIAYATDGSKLIQYDLAKKKVVSEMKLTDSWANGQAAAFSANAEYVAVGDSYDIRIWNLKSGDEQPRLTQKEIQWSMQFTPDAKTLISGGNGKVNVWDVNQSKLQAVQILRQYSNIQSLAISRDGKQFAVPIASDVQVFQLK